MRPVFLILALLAASASFLPDRATGADAALPHLTVGDAAPPIAVESWLKGEPVTSWRPGHVYVVDLWATWCGPCIGSMPDLSRMQSRWPSDVTVIGVNVLEDLQGRPYDGNTRNRVAGFVNELAGSGMIGYGIAYDGSAKLVCRDYLEAAQLASLPQCFIVDRSGRIAHIGNPLEEDFESVVEAVVAGTIDIAASRARFETGRDASAAAARAEAERTAPARERLRAARLAATDLVKEARYDAADACLDTLGGVRDVLGAKVITNTKFSVCRALHRSGDHAAAKGFLGHMITDSGLSAGLDLVIYTQSTLEDVGSPEATDSEELTLLGETLARLADGQSEFREVLIEVAAECYRAAGDGARADALVAGGGANSTDAADSTASATPSSGQR